MSAAFQIFTQPSQQALDASARILPGATLTFTLTGTSTPTNAYSDSGLTTPVANPLSANSAGVFVPVFLNPDVTYRIVLKTAAGVTLQTWDPANENVLSAERIGIQLYDRTTNESSRGITPTHYQYPPGHIFRYMSTAQIASVLARDQTENVTQPLLDAIAAIGTDAATIGGVTTYTGAKVSAPAGTYLISYNAITITTIGLILEGQGAQFYNDFKVPATIFIVDGTSSNSSSFVFKATTGENARGLVCRDIAFQYKNSYAGDYFYWGAAGVTFQNCSFSSNSISGGSPRPVTCNSFLRMFNGHHYRLTGCSFSDAKNAIIIDNATAANTNGWLIHGCSFYDFSDSFITVTSSGASGLDIAACDFDPINNLPTNGIVIIGVGFHIHGCHFAGSDNTSCPVNSWIDINGEGVIGGNAFIYQPGTPSATKAAILVTGGHVHIEGNRISCSSGIIASDSACVTGGNNYFNNLTSAASDIPVRFSQNAASYVNFGPDDVSSGFANSYSIGGSSSIAGFVNYSADKDASTNGPIFQNVLADGISINPVNPKYDTTTTGTLTIKMTGWTFAASGATYTLPASTLASRKIRYRFIKFSSSTVTINAGSGVTLYDGSGKASLTNSTAGEIGVSITIEYVDSTHAVVIAKTGTWA